MKSQSKCGPSTHSSHQRPQTDYLAIYFYSGTTGSSVDVRMFAARVRNKRCLVRKCMCERRLGKRFEVEVMPLAVSDVPRAGAGRCCHSYRDGDDTFLSLIHRLSPLLYILRLTSRSNCMYIVNVPSISQLLFVSFRLRAIRHLLMYRI